MIKLNGISKTYNRGGKGAVFALRDVSLSVAPGEFIAIMGPSGSGKSTLLHLLGFLDKPDEGSYKIFGSEIMELSDDELAILRNHLAGFVFQQFHLLRRVSALENTELPLIYAGKKGMRQTASNRLKEVGLAAREKHRPNELSGGEQQRVAIARALVNDPVIIFADEPTGNLDTKSEKEIIDILRSLNEQGKTIIMVTHEREIAECASRIITVRDGKIVSDEVLHEPPGARLSPGGDKISLKELISDKHSSFRGIESAEHIRQSFRAIFSNKVRSFLSILGILFGVGAVIAMMALGEGAKESIEASLKTLGSNLLSIRGGSARVHGVSGAAGTLTRFTSADVEAVKGLRSVVRRASGVAEGSGQIVYRNANWNTRIYGAGYDYGAMRALVPETGRWFTEDEIARREKVAILGLTVINKLFGGINPVGETIKINRINFKVIGVAPEKGASGHRDQDDVVYIPLTTAMYRVFGKDYIDSFYVEIKEAELIKEGQEEIRQLIIKRHRLTFGKGDDPFYIRDMSEVQEMLSATTNTMSLLLGCIAAISLVVGGIGIMNIMLVSVTERTREIGLRKALGARSGDIMTQFLIESVVMTFSGGLIGILLGMSIAVILSVFAGWATKVSLSSVVLATTFSVIIGIGFGLWPARKAAQLNPIEALRYE
ncbi:MAG: ABC transporter permease [Candidatus Omnitrophota bacterium]